MDFKLLKEEDTKSGGEFSSKFITIAKQSNKLCAAHIFQPPKIVLFYAPLGVYFSVKYSRLFLMHSLGFIVN